MNTGRVAAAFLAAALSGLGGCAANEPPAILSAAELAAMIRVEVEPLEPAAADDAVVAALQP